ncbi:MAG: DUF374 domain-containing protein [Deltaproteobacteria bacterium]|nr:DUF374 domain-containing protein [Deltaproteobacteria bacterium]
MWARFLGRLIAWILRLFRLTWRKRIKGKRIIEDVDRSGRPVIWAFWHGRQAMLYAARRPKGHVVLVSHSRDGEIQTGVLSSFAATIERGSSSRGGAGGMLRLARHLKAGTHAALAADGPKGPALAAKPGAAALAGATGAFIVPISAAAGRCIEFRRSWDDFRLPLPFSRVCVVVGDPIVVDSTSRKDIEAATRRLERALNDVTRQSLEMIGESLESRLPEKGDE